MSGALNVGDKKVLNRPTFLHQGIFVLQGSTVEVMEINGEQVTIQFIDREGNPHLLAGVQPQELV